ncbi:hypothetical protein ACOSQ3_021478 [Xanthoceras sorbifolium]
MESPTDESVLTAITADLRKDRELYWSIYSKPVKTLMDFYKWSNIYIRMEEALGPKKTCNKDRSRSPRDKSKQKDC